MRCVDVTVLVHAHRPEAPQHEAYRDWLEDARTADEPLGLADLVLSAVPPRRDPPGCVPRAHPTVRGSRRRHAAACHAQRRPRRPGDRHWAIVTSLLTDADARGNRVPDAFLAVMCIEQGATWYSADRDFGRFPGLDWRLPVGAS